MSDSLYVAEYTREFTRVDGGVVSSFTSAPLTSRLNTTCFQGMSFTYKGYKDIVIRRLDGMRYEAQPDIVIPQDTPARDNLTRIVFYVTDLGVKVDRNHQPHKSISYDGRRLAEGPILLPEYGIALCYPEHEDRLNTTPFGGSEYAGHGSAWPMGKEYGTVSAVFHTNDHTVNDYFLSVDCGPISKIEVQPSFANKSYLVVTRRNEHGQFVRFNSGETKVVTSVIEVDNFNTNFIHGTSVEEIRQKINQKAEEKNNLSAENEQLKRQLQELNKENSLLKNELSNTKKELDCAIEPMRKSAEQAALEAKRELLEGETQLAINKQQLSMQQMQSESTIQQMKIEKERLATYNSNASTLASTMKTAAVVAPVVVTGAVALSSMFNDKKTESVMSSLMSIIPGSPIVKTAAMVAPFALKAVGGFSGVAKLATKIVGGITKAVTGALGSIKECGYRVFDTVKEYGGRALDTMIDYGGRAISTIKDYGSRAMNAISDFGSSIASGVCGLFT